MNNSFVIRIAGVKVRINTSFSLLKKFCNGYILSQSADSVQSDLDITVDYEDCRRLFPESSQERKGICYSASVLEEIVPIVTIRKIAESMLLHDILLMHGAVVALNNWAYMFVAPSGTGKTTRVNCWMQEFPGSYIVNGDKPFIIAEEGTVAACGSPWCGKENKNTNVKVPLRAIYLTERIEDGQKRAAFPINQLQAFPYLYSQSFQSQNAISVQNTIHLLKVLLQQVKVYRFQSDPSREGVRMAYEAAWNGGDD